MKKTARSSQGQSLGIQKRRLKKNLDRANRRWTKSEEAQLDREFHNGMTLERMAQTHRRTNAAITSRLAKLGLGQARRASGPGAVASPTIKAPDKPAGRRPLLRLLRRDK